MKNVNCPVFIWEFLLYSSASLVRALGGIGPLHGDVRILYCRETFQHPTLGHNESVCEHFGKFSGNQAHKHTHTRTHTPIHTRTHTHTHTHIHTHTHTRTHTHTHSHTHTVCVSTETQLYCIAYRHMGSIPSHCQYPAALSKHLVLPLWPCLALLPPREC